ncbi:hypothetical protein [Bifidobacterium asteroides]|uniref:hypothetical protein n=1 Tax=Bifidobacterium asteroides TaxID=1684 RepID=UPI003A7FB19A
MALCGITYRCGHTDTVQIKGINWFGKRKKKIAWYGTIDCPACRLAKARQEHDGLPALEGSDEQVVRAADIREKMVVLLKVLERLDEAQKEHDRRAGLGTTEEQKAFARTVAWIKAQASASWWIDHQDQSEVMLAAREALHEQEA